MILAPYTLAFGSCSLQACILFLLPTRLHLILAPCTFAFAFAGGHGILGRPARGAAAGQDHAAEACKRNAQQTSCVRVSQLKLANAMHNRQVASE